ncbi:MAG: PQQ-binding-like beta-propeller repeat protein [Gemmataceae bacterium]|nr:PQQ-binding-like beta-propeller repeat protein [Gemmataceae bacterium]
MASSRPQRWVAGVCVVGVFAGVVAFLPRDGKPSNVVAAQPAAAARAADWIMYGGTPSRNMVNTVVKGLPAEWDLAKKTNIRWEVDLGSKAYGGPVIADGKVFVGTNNQKPRDPKDVDPTTKRPIDLGVLMCFEEATGKFLWQLTFPKLAAGRVVDWPLEGICSTPYIEGDKLYFVSNRCEVICAATKDGSIQWKLDMIKTLGVFPHNLSVCSPLVVGDDLFIITSNGVDEGHINVPAPKAPSFIRVEKKTGKVLWGDNDPTIRLTEIPKGGDDEAYIKRLVNRGELIQHGQWSNPAYGVVDGQAQVVFPGGNGWIYSYDPASNKLLWKFDCNPKTSVYELSGKGTRNDFIATPVIHKNRVYIAVGQDPEHETGVGHLWCIDMTKRGDVSPEIVEKWGASGPETKKNPDSALVWHYGESITDPAERKKLGRNYYFGRTMSTCALHEGLCYAADLGGTLFCLDADTGKLHWSHETGGMTWSSPYFVDGKVYFGNDDNILYVFEHGKAKKLISENDMESRVRATPVAANGALFVMTENKLRAIEEKK